MIQETLEYISQGLDLTQEHAFKVMHDIMEGKWTASQIAGFLMALKMKGETVSEISGFVNAMRDKAVKINPPPGAVDTCGTGGDGLHSFNVSTAAAIVAAAADIPVAKHGNRSVSSKAGSADVLQALGVNIELTAEQAERCLHETGIAFLFAPVYHASMKHAVMPRKEMGIRTVFNILGPMSNPALTRRQVIGVFNFEVAEKMVHVLKETGSEHVMVVHSNDGMDELAISSETVVNELQHGEITTYEITPEDLGLTRSDLSHIKGGTAEDNAEIMRRVFTGESGPLADITALNAGAGIYVSGKAESLKQGLDIARDLLRSGKAREKLSELVDFTHTVN